MVNKPIIRRENFPSTLYEEERDALREITGLTAFSDDFVYSSWENLHKLKSDLNKAKRQIEALRDERKISEKEQSAYDVINFLRDCIAEEFKIRESFNTRGPVDISTVKPSGGGFQLPEKHPKTFSPRSYRALFHGHETAPLDDGEFSSFDEFLRMVASGRTDARLERRTHLATSGISGGFTVPTEYAGWLIDKSLETEIVRSRAAVYPMTSMEKVIVAWNNSNHAEDLFGGFQAEWLAENTEATIQTGTIRTVTLKAKKLAIYAEASREVLADGINFAEQLGSALVKSIGFYLDSAFLSGEGAGRPLGVLHSPSAIEVIRSGANSICWTDIYTMFSRLHPMCHNGAVWVANHSVLPQLMNLQVNNNLVFVPGMFTGIAGAVPGSLFGKEIVFTEKTPSLGVRGDLMLVDFSQYAIGLREDVVLDRSNSPGWLRDVESYRVILRVDGCPLWFEPVTPKSGSPLSWAVVLR